MEQLQTEILIDEAAFRNLKEDWTILLQNSNHNTPFMSWDGFMNATRIWERESPPICMFVVYSMRRNLLYDTTKAKKELGRNPRGPWKMVWKESLNGLDAKI